MGFWMGVSLFSSQEIACAALDRAFTENVCLLVRDLHLDSLLPVWFTPLSLSVASNNLHCMLSKVTEIEEDKSPGDTATRTKGGKRKEPEGGKADNPKPAAKAKPAPGPKKEPSSN